MGRETRGTGSSAFSVADIDAVIETLTQCGVEVEPIRIDEYTAKRYPFFSDPDLLPLELYEQ